MITGIPNNNKMACIEADTTVAANAITRQADTPDGLVRISHAQASASEYVFDDSAEESITVYVIDSGIKIGHSEFRGRAVWGANFVDQVVSRYQQMELLGNSRSMLTCGPGQ